LTTTVAPTGAKTGGAGRAVNGRRFNMGICLGFLVNAIVMSL
jgi:hypothetical protein